MVPVPLPYLDHQSLRKPRFVSLFAGVGGFDKGLEDAGMECVGQVEIDKHAQAVLNKHWPDVPKHNDVSTAIEWAHDIGLIGNVDGVAGGFPCFPAGTLILTTDGYRPIEDIAVGDVVLTHTGTWRAVNQTMNRVADHTLTVATAYLPPLVTTNEHPFYTLSNPNNTCERTPTWVAAEDLRPGALVGQTVPKVASRAARDSSGTNTAVWWLVGRFLADGSHTPGLKAPVAIWVETGNDRDIREHLLAAALPWIEDTDAAGTTFWVTSQWFADFLTPLGTATRTRTLTRRELELSTHDARAIINGWMSANPQASTYPTVSARLAFSIRLLAQRAVLPVPTIHADPSGIYTVSFPRTATATLNGVAYQPVTTTPAHTRTSRPTRVYNIGVEHDESYIANGIIVHNCQDVSVAGKRAGLAGQRTGLFWDALAFATAVQARWVLLENVPGLLTSNNGRDFGTVITALADAGFTHVEWRVVDSQYFGVPQRRRRVIIVGHTGELGRSQILAEPEGSRRYPAASNETRTNAPTSAARSADRPRVTVGTLDLSQGGPDDNDAYAGRLPVVYHKAKRAQTADDDETWREGGPTPTLNGFDVGDTRATTIIVNPDDTTQAEVTPMQDERDIDKHQNGRGIANPGVPAYTPDAPVQAAVVTPLAYRGRDDGAQLELGTPGVSNTLRAGDGGSSRSSLILIEPATESTDDPDEPGWFHAGGDIMATLNSAGNTGGFRTEPGEHLLISRDAA